MSPLFIKTALEFYYRPGIGKQYKEEVLANPALEGVINQMGELGMLELSEERNGYFIPTEGLQAYVQRLMQVPAPQKIVRWEFPDEVKKMTGPVSY